MEKTDKLEKIIQKMVESKLNELNLPENFDSVKVDIWKTEYGNNLKVTILMKTYFSGEDSDFFDKPMKNIKNLISDVFGDFLTGGIRYAVSTVDNYWFYKKLTESNMGVKIVITETKLKTFIKNKLGVDLTDKVNLVTNKWELPKEFNRTITPSALNHYLNRFGPMYAVEVDNNTYLLQDQGDRIVIVDSNDKIYDEFELMNKIGIPPLGIKLKDILDLYVDEEL